MARYKCKKRRKRKPDEPVYRCPVCNGVLEQVMDYGDTFKCDWCGYTCPVVRVGGVSCPDTSKEVIQ